MIEARHARDRGLVEGGAAPHRLEQAAAALEQLLELGERLRRLDWNDARMEDDRLVARLDPERFRALPELAKDEWPGH